MSFIAIRGATTTSKNTSDDILNATEELILKIEKLNKIKKEEVISIIFSCTEDLDQAYPAKAARKLGYTNTGLMCFNEMNVNDGLKKCIRIMIYCNSKREQKDVKHVYLKNAKNLRPDLEKKV